jgi:predicted nuclease of restriction endonuclease-like RecB superfamily
VSPETVIFADRAQYNLELVTTLIHRHFCLNIEVADINYLVAVYAIYRMQLGKLISH